MKKIMHVAESFASGVLNFLADLTKWQVEEYEVYVLYGVRPLTPVDVGGLFDKRVRLIRVGSFRGAMGTVLNAGAYRDVRRWYGDEFERLMPHAGRAGKRFTILDTI